jgi:hypothetical protein
MTTSYWNTYCKLCTSNESCEDCDGCKQTDGEPSEYKNDESDNKHESCKIER